MATEVRLRTLQGSSRTVLEDIRANWRQLLTVSFLPMAASLALFAVTLPLMQEMAQRSLDVLNGVSKPRFDLRDAAIGIFTVMTAILIKIWLFTRIVRLRVRAESGLLTLRRAELDATLRTFMYALLVYVLVFAVSAPAALLSMLVAFGASYALGMFPSPPNTRVRKV